MNTIPQLKAEIAAYLQREVSEFYDNGIDLLLTAINSAHTEAQKHRDFELAKCTVDIPVSLTRGAPMGVAKLHGTETVVSLKKILRAAYSDHDGILPLEFTTQGSEAYNRWLRNRAGYSWSPPLQQDLISLGQVIQSGTQLYFYGGAAFGGQDPAPLMFDAIRLFPDYSDDEAATSNKDDFLLQYGYEYMFWFALCRLNYRNKEFVQREEGNVSPPKDERKDAWDKLIAWDASLIYSGDTSIDLD